MSVQADYEPMELEGDSEDESEDKVEDVRSLIELYNISAKPEDHEYDEPEHQVDEPEEEQKVWEDEDSYD